MIFIRSWVPTAPVQSAHSFYFILDTKVWTFSPKKLKKGGGDNYRRSGSKKPRPAKEPWCSPPSPQPLEQLQKHCSTKWPLTELPSLHINMPCRPLANSVLSLPPVRVVGQPAAQKPLRFQLGWLQETLRHGLKNSLSLTHARNRHLSTRCCSFIVLFHSHLYVFRVLQTLCEELKTFRKIMCILEDKGVKIAFFFSFSWGLSFFLSFLDSDILRPKWTIRSCDLLYNKGHILAILFPCVPVVEPMGAHTAYFQDFLRDKEG